MGYSQPPERMTIKNGTAFHNKTRRRRMSRPITLKHTLSYGSANLLGKAEPWPLPARGCCILHDLLRPDGGAGGNDFLGRQHPGCDQQPHHGVYQRQLLQHPAGRKFGRRRFFILTGIPLVLLYPLMWD